MQPRKRLNTTEHKRKHQSAQSAHEKNSKRMSCNARKSSKSQQSLYESLNEKSGEKFVYNIPNNVPRLSEALPRPMAPMKQPQNSHISVIQIHKLAETPNRRDQFSSRKSSSESSMGIDIKGTRSDSLNLTEEESKHANEDLE